MISENLEFSISQYVDGTLSADERAAVEAELAVDPSARAALAEHRRLNDLLATPPAGLDWDRVASHLTAFVADGNDHVAVAGRIGWRSPWRIGSIAAAAAGVAVTVGLLAHRGRPSPVVPVPSESVAVVTGPSVEAPAGPAEADVKIGPSPALAARGESWRYAEGVVGRPSTAVIAAAKKVPGRGERYR